MSDSTNKFEGMFQDSAGTIPVTKSGQPVGLCISQLEGKETWHSKANHRPILKTQENMKCWWDPSDLSTLFQDRAGTVPVLKDGDPVRLVVDKTGNGNHLKPDEGSVYRTDGIRQWISIPLDDEFKGVRNDQ